MSELSLEEKDDAVFRASVVLSLSEIIGVMQEVMPLSGIAEVGGISETKAIHEWQSGERKPRPRYEQRLRTAVHIVKLLHDPDNPTLAGAWFFALNPVLGEKVPAHIIRRYEPLTSDEENVRCVIQAARIFVDSAHLV